MSAVAWLSPLRAWMRWKWRVLADVPRPTDRAVASSPGEPAIECLALGNGPISSWGVATHQIGFVGAFARGLARKFGRGAVVRATIDWDWTVRDMRVAAAGMPWESAQVGVLSFGPNEVLASARVSAWARDLEGLVGDVRARMPEGSVLAVLGMPPMSSLSFLHGAGASFVTRLVARYTAATRAVCAGLEGVRFVPLPDSGRPRAGEYRSAEGYTRWADAVVAAIAVDPAGVRREPASESERAAAVERLALLDTAPEERFDRIVRLARSVFRTRAAGFSLLHGDRQWFKARAGVRVAELPREAALCDLVIRQGSPLVVGDATQDPRFAASPLVQKAGIRFYAGYPLRAPDGHFVGALCVYDEQPRDPADVDISVLRELALMLEAELGETEREPSARRGSRRRRVRAS